MSDVAVIIPCFNLGSTILETIESVYRQTRLPAEILVIDDGSDEPDTIRTLRTLASSGVCVVRTTNLGVAASRNLGVRLTESELIVLLDADDILEARYVDRLGAVLDSDSELAFVTCTLRAFGTASYSWTPPACTAADALARGGPHSASLFRREVWTAVGGFDTSLNGYEDTDFWVSAMLAGCRGTVVQESLLRYRVRPGSRYSHAISSTYLATAKALLERHVARLSADEKRELIAEKFAFVEDQRKHAASVMAETAEASARACETTADIDAIRRRLAANGVSSVDGGDVLRLTPISSFWGFDRGTPLDRYYIETFLGYHRSDIVGFVLEVKDAGYTKRFGSDVTRSDIIDVDPANPFATVRGDLSSPRHLPTDVYDCFICTQTLHLVSDLKEAVLSAWRLLKPGGVFLGTFPTMSRVSDETVCGGPPDNWRLTPPAVDNLFCEVFLNGDVTVEAFGNVKSCGGFLLGLAAEDLSATDLAFVDPQFPLIAAVRAVKSRRPRAPQADDPRDYSRRGAVLSYHRIGDVESDRHNLATDISSFRSHMAYVATCCRVLPLAEMVAMARDGLLPSQAVALTFDDGYLEHLEVVAPVLRDFGLPATFFVNTARVNDAQEAWWDEIERIFFTGFALPDVFDPYGDGRLLFRVSTNAERERAHSTLVQLMYPASAEKRVELLARFRAWHQLDLNPRPSHRLLRGEELRLLSSIEGMTIGAHSENHLSLPSQPVEVRREEINRCKETLEELLCKPVTSFAYPYGEYDVDTVGVLRESGLRTAVTVEPRRLGCASMALRIPRFEVPVRGGSLEWLTRHLSDDAKRQQAPN